MFDQLNWTPSLTDVSTIGSAVSLLSRCFDDSQDEDRLILLLPVLLSTHYQQQPRRVQRLFAAAFRSQKARSAVLSAASEIPFEEAVARLVAPYFVSHRLIPAEAMRLLPSLPRVFVTATSPSSMDSETVKFVLNAVTEFAAKGLLSLDDSLATWLLECSSSSSLKITTDDLWKFFTTFVARRSVSDILWFAVVGGLLSKISFSTVKANPEDEEDVEMDASTDAAQNDEAEDMDKPELEEVPITDYELLSLQQRLLRMVDMSVLSKNILSTSSPLFEAVLLWERLLIHALRFLSDEEIIMIMSRDTLVSATQLAIRRENITLVRLLFERNARMHFLPSEISHLLRVPTTKSRKLFKYIVDFRERVRQFRDALMQLAPDSHAGFSYGESVVTIHRHRILEDAFHAYYPRISSLRDRGLRVVFADEPGMGNGVVKEFLSELCRQAFSPQYGLFSYNADAGIILPNPDSIHLLGMVDDAGPEFYNLPSRRQHPLALDYYRFLGAFLAKCIFEGILVDAPLADFFFGKLVGYKARIDDLPAYDAQVHKNLLFIRNLNEESPADCSLLDDLCLFFAAVESDITGRTVELVPGGSQLKVTMSNRALYVAQMADLKLNRLVEPLARSFASGFFEVIPRALLHQHFRFDELRRLVCGADAEIDVEDWRRHTVYNGYTDDDKTMMMFWDIVASDLTSQQRSMLLRFATSSPRAPMLGFSALYPQFAIQRGEWDGDEQRLPTSATCFNTLRLPPYPSREAMKHAIVTAIENTSGFGLV
jgi:ubiquitin-protein ligase E3 C